MKSFVKSVCLIGRLQYTAVGRSARRTFSTLDNFEGYFANVKKYERHMQQLFADLLCRAHEDLGNQLMNSTLTADDIARISREYSALGRKNELAEKRAELMQSINGLIEMEAEERKKYDPADPQYNNH